MKPFAPPRKHPQKCGKINAITVSLIALGIAIFTAIICIFN